MQKQDVNRTIHVLCFCFLLLFRRRAEVFGQTLCEPKVRVLESSTTALSFILIHFPPSGHHVKLFPSDKLQNKSK